MLLKITAVIESKNFLGFLLPFCCTGLLQCHCPGGQEEAAASSLPQSDVAEGPLLLQEPSVTEAHTEST